MPPRRTCAAMSMSKPAWRSAARSAMVAFEPGRMTRSASPGSAAARLHAHEVDRGLRIERIEIVEIGDVRQDRDRDPHARRGFDGRAASSASASSAGSRRASAKNGTRPSACQPVARAIVAMPSANSAGSPRNLLTRKPRISAASCGVDHRLGADEARDHAAAVDVADQHDRHIGRARKAHIGDVVRRRLTSEALPAPSTSTRSASALRRAKLSSTNGMRSGFMP